MIVALLIAFQGAFLNRLDDARDFHVDETMWIPYGSYAFDLLFIRGDTTTPFWNDDLYTYGAYNPPVGKYLIGLGTYLAGYRAIPFTTYDWDQSTQWNLDNGRIDGDMFAAARLPIALSGMLGCLLLAWLVALVWDIWHGALAACVLLAGQLWLQTSRWAMLDAPGVAFGLLAAVCLWYLVAALRRSSARSACGWAVACGLACGLAVGSKLSAGLTIIACLLTLVLEGAVQLAQRRATPWPWLCGAVIVAVAAAVFVGSNPFLYTDPVGGMRHMLAFTAVMGSTTGALAPTDSAGKLLAVLDQLFTFAPLRQLGLPGDAVVLHIGLVALLITCWRDWQRCWERQISTLLVWMLVMFVGITLWLPIAWARYTLPLQPWSALMYAYGVLWMVRWFRWKTRHPTFRV